MTVSVAQAADLDRIVVLQTGLFRDAVTLEAALSAQDHPIVIRHRVDPEVLDRTGWDAILNDILSAKIVLTL